MKKSILFISQALILFLFGSTAGNTTWSQQNKKQVPPLTEAGQVSPAEDAYRYPAFYRGIYLNIYTARSIKKLTDFIEKSKSANINSFVLDVHFPKKTDFVLTAGHVELCKKNNIHPIARVVVFQDGLKKYPVSPDEIERKIRLAENACEAGFREIQFDYIRFEDRNILRRLSRDERYNFIEGFLKTARDRLKKYNAITAADVFGRIPLNKGDAIGQRIEGLDNVVDIICPMAYPSHYTWSRKMMSNPYYTVLLTSKSARDRTQNADIVTYIQAFKMKLSISNMSFEKYIEAQVKAVHDSGIKGYIFWNASQNYETPFNVMKDYYENKTKSADSSIIKDKAS